MKSVNTLMLMCLALLSGCATQPQVTAPAPVTLQETRSLLPRQAYDEKGMKIAYQPAENPYLLQSGTVNKGSVLLFIEARKALAADDEKTAVQKLNVIIRNDKTLSGPFVMLGDIDMKHERFADAAANYQQALSINAINVNAYLGLAEAQRRLGQFLQAQNTYAAALRQWPDFPEAHLNLGVLLDLYLNKPEQAQAHYEAFLFLTHYRSHAAHEWLDEIRSRTGIKHSLIDPGSPLSGNTASTAEGGKSS